MRLGFDLTLEQTQKLVMTPELRQAIQILQFNNHELWEYIEEQMETNPFLDIDSRTKREENIEDLNSKLENIDWKEYFRKYDDISYSGNWIASEENQSFENFVSAGTTLKEYLLFQLNLSVYQELHKQIGEMIIEGIDGNGYLDIPLEEISRQLSVSLEEVENVLKIIQSFEPVGVAARNLKESLIIQLKAKKIEDSLVYTVVDKYLEDVAQNRIMKVAKELNITLKRTQEIFDLIKTLEPKPGRGYTHEKDRIKYITPDVVLEYVNGEYIIVVNDITAPRLRLSTFYRRLLNRVDDEKIAKFLNDKLNSSMWLIKSIEQRRMTIYKVVQSIVKFQIDFFEKGTKALKPLILKDVADDIGVHESTVSRAINEKYIQTPRGIFELKFFFSNGMPSQGGEISATSIKSMIKELIENEDPKKPLSDQKISNLLKGKRIQISRRTVAKYRDEMNIPSSSIRRRY